MGGAAFMQAARQVGTATQIVELRTGPRFMKKAL